MAYSKYMRRKLYIVFLPPNYFFKHACILSMKTIFQPTNQKILSHLCIPWKNFNRWLSVSKSSGFFFSFLHRGIYSSKLSLGHFDFNGNQLEAVLFLKFCFRIGFSRYSNKTLHVWRLPSKILSQKTIQIKYIWFDPIKTKFRPVISGQWKTLLISWITQEINKKVSLIVWTFW